MTCMVSMVTENKKIKVDAGKETVLRVTCLCVGERVLLLDLYTEL